MLSTNIRQNFAGCNGNTLPCARQQNAAVDAGYRTVLATNLDALLRFHQTSAERLKATYVDGTKKGKRVAPRTIRNALRTDTPAPGIDALAALAAALGVQVYHLLVPTLDPWSHPPMQSEGWIEAEVSRRVAAGLRAARRSQERLENADAEERGRPNAGSPFIDSEVSVGSTPVDPAKKKARPKAKAAR
jgi:hypothetical protein